MTGRISAGQRASVQNVYTGNYAYGQRGATYDPTTGVSARGGSATYGNVDTGQQGSARWGHVSGPGGQSASAARVGNNYYASRDGNVYRNTGSGWESYSNGSWTSVQAPSQAPGLDAQQQARQAGDQRSAGSNWSSVGWGGGFSPGGAGYSPGAAGGYRGGGAWGGAGGWDRGGGFVGGGAGWGGAWGGGRFGGGFGRR
jgi:hypothetical protein